MPTDRRQHGAVADEPAIDATDRALLALLQADARLSYAELGRRVALSPPAVAERVARLERTGVVRGYHADVDPAKLGWSLSVVIRLRPAPRQLPQAAELVRSLPEVVECERVTGEDCFVLKAHVRDVTHLEELIDLLVAHGQTTTSVVQSAPVPRRPVAL